VTSADSASSGTDLVDDPERASGVDGVTLALEKEMVDRGLLPFPRETRIP